MVTLANFNRPNNHPPTPTLFSLTFIPREERHRRTIFFPGMVHLKNTRDVEMSMACTLLRDRN